MICRSNSTSSIILQAISDINQYLRRVRACFGYTFGTKGDTGEDLDQTDLTKEHQEEFMVWDFTDCEHSTSSKSAAPEFQQTLTPRSHGDSLRNIHLCSLIDSKIRTINCFSEDSVVTGKTS